MRTPTRLPWHRRHDPRKPVLTATRWVAAVTVVRRAREACAIEPAV